MVNTLAKTTLREIRHSLGRYVAILAIIAIGVAIFSGLRMSQPAMIETGVVYLEEYAFHDFRLISTLGFTEEDVEEFSALDGIESACGSVYTEFLWQNDSDDEKVLIAHSPTDKVNIPELSAGRMPQNGSECLADANYFSEDDIGRTIVVSAHNDEDTLELLKYAEYTIVGLTHSPLYINYERGTSSIGSGSISAFVLMPSDAFDTDIYYEVYLRVSQRVDAYSDDYKPVIDDVKPHVEKLLTQRAELRYKTLRSDAIDEISEGELELADGWEEYRSQRAEAEAELADALKTLEDGEIEYAEGLADYEKGKNDYYSGLSKYQDGLEELTDAEEKLAEGRAEFEKAKTEAEAELADALKKLEDGEIEYADGLLQLQHGQSDLDAAAAEIAENESLLAQSKSELDAAKADLDAAQEQLDQLSAYISQMEQQLASLDPASPQYAALSAELEAYNATYNNSYYEYLQGLKEYNDGLAQYEAGMAQLEQAKSELQAAQSQLDIARSELDSARSELDNGWQEYEIGKAEAEAELARAEEELLDAEKEIDQGRAELEDAKQKLDDALYDLLSAPAELEDARAELDDGWQEYYDGLAEAEEEFAKAEDELLDGQREINEAYDELDKLKDADTYTLTRSENTGYACFDSDTSIVAAISVVFPVFFFLVAALVCMTTMKRMVDEQRTQIGILKAIGYSRRQITGKYLFYSGSAAAFGCVLGYVLGSTCLPLILWEIYGIMYGFAPLEIVFDPWLALLTFAASMLCSMGATYLSCRAELTRPAAELIRPKTPKAGKRVFLEHITPIWKHLSFLQKVSVRNVLRYRSRFVMMVLGIGGCTALLVTGFGIRDSISNIAQDQYGEITVYDYSVSFSEALSPEGADDYLASLGIDADGLLVHYGSTDVVTDSDSRTVYLVSPASNSLEGYISLHQGDQPVPFPKNGEAVINTGLAEDLGLTVGDSFTLRDTDIGTVTVTLSDLCDNYISNYVYVSPETFSAQLGVAPEFNTLLVNSQTGADPNEESVLLGEDDRVSTVSVSATARDRVTTTLERLDLIVVVVVVFSGALAFVVLYNLTNINITERIREIATVKVLGFYPGETATYVFREINMLACVGSLVGLLMGRALHSFVMAQIQVEAMFFPNRVNVSSYVLSFVFTMLFTVLITNSMRPKLRNIHMAESLKSIE